MIRGTVLMAFEKNGSKVVLIDQCNGYLQVLAQQKGQPERVVGMFEKAQLLVALNRYGEARDAMALVA